jgi:hypothetical protein
VFGRNDDAGWTADPTDVVGAGAQSYEDVIGIPASRSMVGGPQWNTSGMVETDVGLQRLVGEMAPAATAHGTAMLDDWRDVLNWRDSPAPWILLAILAAIGFVHLRVNTKAGPYHAKLGIG